MAAVNYTEIAKRLEQVCKEALLTASIDVEDGEYDCGFVSIENVGIYQSDADDRFYVCRLIYNPGSYWQPPETSEEEVSDHEKLDDAVKAAICLMIEERIQSFFDYEDMNTEFSCDCCG